MNEFDLYSGPSIIENYAILINLYHTKDKSLVKSSIKYIKFSLPENSFSLKNSHFDEEYSEVFIGKSIVNFYEELIDDEMEYCPSGYGIRLNVGLKKFLIFFQDDEIYVKWIRILKFFFFNIDIQRPHLGKLRSFLHTEVYININPINLILPEKLNDSKNIECELSGDNLLNLKPPYNNPQEKCYDLTQMHSNIFDKFKNNDFFNLIDTPFNSNKIYLNNSDNVIKFNNINNMTTMTSADHLRKFKINPIPEVNESNFKSFDMKNISNSNIFTPRSGKEEVKISNSKNDVAIIRNFNTDLHKNDTDHVPYFGSKDTPSISQKNKYDKNINTNNENFIKENEKKNKYEINFKEKENYNTMTNFRNFPKEFISNKNDLNLKDNLQGYQKTNIDTLKKNKDFLNYQDVDLNKIINSVSNDPRKQDNKFEGNETYHKYPLTEQNFNIVDDQLANDFSPKFNDIVHNTPNNKKNETIKQKRDFSKYETNYNNSIKYKFLFENDEETIKEKTNLPNKNQTKKSEPEKILIEDVWKTNSIPNKAIKNVEEIISQKNSNKIYTYKESIPLKTTKDSDSNIESKEFIKIIDGSIAKNNLIEFDFKRESYKDLEDFVNWDVVSKNKTLSLNFASELTDQRKKQSPEKLTDDKNLHLKIKGDNNRMNLENLHYFSSKESQQRHVEKLLPVRMKNSSNFILNETCMGLETKRRQDLKQMLNLVDDESTQIFQVKPQIEHKTEVPFVNVEGESFVINVTLGDRNSRMKESSMTNKFNKSINSSTTFLGSSQNLQFSKFNRNENEGNNYEIIKNSNNNLAEICKSKVIQQENQNVVYTGKNKPNPHKDVSPYENNNSNMKNFFYEYEKNKKNNDSVKDEKNIDNFAGYKDERFLNSRLDMNQYEDIENPFTNNHNQEKNQKIVTNFDVKNEKKVELKKKNKSFEFYSNQNYSSHLNNSKEESSKVNENESEKDNLKSISKINDENGKTFDKYGNIYPYNKSITSNNNSKKTNNKYLSNNGIDMKRENYNEKENKAHIDPINKTNYNDLNNHFKESLHLEITKAVKVDEKTQIANDLHFEGLDNYNSSNNYNKSVINNSKINQKNYNSDFGNLYFSSQNNDNLRNLNGTYNKSGSTLVNEMNKAWKN